MAGHGARKGIRNVGTATWQAGSYARRQAGRQAGGLPGWQAHRPAEAGMRIGWTGPLACIACHAPCSSQIRQSLDGVRNDRNSHSLRLQ